MNEEDRKKLAFGKNAFLEYFETKGLPVKDAVNLWELAYTAGKLVAIDKSNGQFKEHFRLFFGKPEKQ